MLYWWQFVLILLAVVVLIAVGMFVMSFPEFRRYMRIKRM